MALKRLSSTCTEVSGLSENSDMNSVRGWVFNKPKSGPNETTQFTQLRQGYLSVPDLVMGFIAWLLSISLQAPEGCREYWGVAGVKQVKRSPWEVVVSSWFNNPTWSMSCLSQIELERLVQVIKDNSLLSQATASLIPFIDQIKCISKWTFLYWFFLGGGVGCGGRGRSGDAFSETGTCNRNSLSGFHPRFLQSIPFIILFFLPSSPSFTYEWQLRKRSMKKCCQERSSKTYH